jgi:hypothetical protein
LANFLQNLAKKAGDAASRVYDQGNILDNGLSYKTRQVNPNQPQRSVIQQAAPIGAAIVRAPVQMANTVAAQAPQAYYTGQGLLAQLTHNQTALQNALAMQHAANQQFNQNKGGLLNMGTFYNAQDAERGNLGTGVKKIGGGVLQTAATIAPFAKGGTVALMAGKMPLVKAAPLLAGEGAAYGTAFSAGSQLQNQGHINPKQLVRDAALTSVANVALPGLARGAKTTANAGIRQFKNGNEIGAVGPDVSQSAQKIQAADAAIAENKRLLGQQPQPAPLPRPSNDLQTQLEAAWNGNDLNGAQNIINQMPPELKAPMQNLQDMKLSKPPAPAPGSVEAMRQSNASALKQLDAVLADYRKNLTAPHNEGGYINLSGFKKSKSGQEPVGSPAAGNPQNPARSSSPTIPEGQKLSRFANKTVQGSPEVGAPLKKLVKEEQVTYDPHTNEGRLAAADAWLKGKSNDKAYTEIVQTFENPKNVTDQHVVNAITAAKKLDASGKEADLFKATEIYDNLSRHLSQKGQEIQAAALLSNRTPQGLYYAAQKELKKGGVELTPQIQKELKALADKTKASAPGSEERALAVHDLQRYVGSKVPSNLSDKLTNAWRAGLLTSPVTSAGNILGNTTEAVTRNVWSNPVAAATDKALSVFTGKRTKTLTGHQASGAVQGSKVGLQQLKTGYDPTRGAGHLNKFDVSGKYELNYGKGKAGKAMGAYVNGVYRFLGAQDKVFRYAAQFQAARDMALADAKNLGLKGAQKDAYMAKAMVDPNWRPQTFKANNSAEEAGAYAVYANDTLLGKMASGVKQKAAEHSGFGSGIANFLLPFSQVPSSVAMRIIDRTPIGIAREFMGQFGIPGLIKGKGFNQRALSESIGNGTFAPGVLAAGYALSKAGEITGNYPTDPKEQELWRMEGKQANAVRIGNRWYSLNYMQPFGTLLGVGAQAQKDAQAGKSPDEVMSKAIGTAVKSVESQSFLQGVNGALSAINDPERSANQYLSTSASSVVPNFIRTGARATDPNQRAVKGPVAGVKSAIPGEHGRQSLPVKQDAFGRGLPAIDNALNQFLNPGRPNISKTNDQVVNELRRLQDTKNGIIPTQFSKDAFNSDGKGTNLTDKQVRDLQSAVGGKVYDAWGQLMKTDQYKGLSDADKNTALKNTMDKISEAEKSQYAAKNQLGQFAADFAGKQTKLSKDAKNYLSGTLDITKFARESNGKGGSGIEISKNISGNSKTILQAYDEMDTSARNKYFNSANDAEYKYQQAKYENDSANGTLSKAQDAKAKYGLNQAKVGSKFSKETRDYYSLNKTELYDLLSNEPNGQAMADQIVSYGDALESNGLGNNKFRDSKGNVSIAPKARTASPARAVAGR